MTTSATRKVEKADLVIDCVMSSVIFVYASYVMYNLKIRLNVGSRIRWLIIFIAILLRVSLTIYEFLSDSYDVEGWRFYYLWLIEQTHFMIILMLFFSVIGSWHISS